MARLSFSGLDELALSLREIADIPDGVAQEMLEAEAKVVEEYQMGSAATMLAGPYATGQTAYSIRRGRMKRGKDGERLIYVSPQGTNDRGERNAAVAFINEYGKRGQPARPFIATASEAAATPATEAAAEVYDKWLKSKNL